GCADQTIVSSRNTGQRETFDHQASDRFARVLIPDNAYNQLSRPSDVLKGSPVVHRGHVLRAIGINPAWFRQLAAFTQQGQNTQLLAGDGRPVNPRRHEAVAAESREAKAAVRVRGYSPRQRGHLLAHKLTGKVLPFHVAARALTGLDGL